MIKFEYFNECGKWKYDGSIEIEDSRHRQELFNFLDRENLSEFLGDLPGLTCSEWKGPIRVEGPWGFPHLLPRGITEEILSGD